jgi:hypothetical protein
VRFAFGGSGKRGGDRAIFLMVADCMVAMLFAYAQTSRKI